MLVNIINTRYPQVVFKNTANERTNDNGDGGVQNEKLLRGLSP